MEKCNETHAIARKILLFYGGYTTWISWRKCRLKTAFYGGRSAIQKSVFACEKMSVGNRHDSPCSCWCRSRIHIVIIATFRSDCEFQYEIEDEYDFRVSKQLRSQSSRSSLLRNSGKDTMGMILVRQITILNPRPGIEKSCSYSILHS